MKMYKGILAVVAVFMVGALSASNDVATYDASTMPAVQTTEAVSAPLSTSESTVYAPASSATPEMYTMEETSVTVEQAPVASQAAAMVDVHNKLKKPLYIKLGNAGAWNKINASSKVALPLYDGSVWVSCEAENPDQYAQKFDRKNVDSKLTDIKISKSGFWRDGKEISFIYDHGWNVFNRESYDLASPREKSSTKEMKTETVQTVE